MPQPITIILDDESADRLLAVRKKLFLSKTAAIKLLILIGYNQEVLGTGQVPAADVEAHRIDTIKTSKMSSEELEKVLATI